MGTYDSQAPADQTPSTDRCEIFVCLILGEITKYIKNCYNRLAPRIGEIRTNVISPYTRYLTFSPNNPIDQITGPIRTNDGSNDAVWPTKVLLGGRVFTKFCLESKNPQTAVFSSKFPFSNHSKYLE
jgi:hypothetical protein